MDDKIKKTNLPEELNREINDPNAQNGSSSAEKTLDDVQRIKVLSPSMMVMRRFIRNRLAIAGLIIIIAMFLFSFVGGLLHPFGETQIFYKKEDQSSRYASATVNNNYYYDVAEGKNFNSLGLAQFILARNNGTPTFSAKINGKDLTFSIQQVGDDSYLLNEGNPVLKITLLGGNMNYSPASGFNLSEAFKSAFFKAYNAGETIFSYGSEDYAIQASKLEITVSTFKPAVLLSKNIYDAYKAAFKPDFSFKLASETTLTALKKTMAEQNLGQSSSSFEYNGESYVLEVRSGSDISVISSVKDGVSAPIANISKIVVTPYASDIFLTVEYKSTVAKAISEGLTEFEALDNKGEAVHFSVERKDLEYVIRTDLTLDLIDSYALPSTTHWLGTDGSGMDVLVRLMYGGRISLMIGFVVVVIETLIGIVIGGISGYFGKWIDTLLMRLVEIFNCIPTLPLFIIIGTAMSVMKIDPTVRIYLLMVLLGVTGWPGIARVVRGQILSLREQEFMTAAEASGLSTSRKIFKHLIPNVIPQLIVYATMGLGSVILTEATLSFLGLGVKYPYASWGNIINSVNDSYVLQNYWFVWIPAGFLILLTVLGFNFIGDGLRDAFDPKMKR
ncbi:MAG TPA: ABC transporter permease [Oscillospiraceae bacterium]|nr:ABC transporter permease [Oscillospiraceae bacterium]HPS33878.1 ABC transporter permease [Oscillospiraceae bacterium]